jgi:hypothetical protein
MYQTDISQYQTDISHSIKLTFLSIQLTFLSIKLTFLSVKLTFLSSGESQNHRTTYVRYAVDTHCTAGLTGRRGVSLVDSGSAHTALAHSSKT